MKLIELEDMNAEANVLINSDYIIRIYPHDEEFSIIDIAANNDRGYMSLTIRGSYETLKLFVLKEFT